LRMANSSATTCITVLSVCARQAPGALGRLWVCPPPPFLARVSTPVRVSCLPPRARVGAHGTADPGSGAGGCPARVVVGERVSLPRVELEHARAVQPAVLFLALRGPPERKGRRSGGPRRRRSGLWRHRGFIAAARHKSQTESTGPQRSRRGGGAGFDAVQDAVPLVLAFLRVTFRVRADRTCSSRRSRAGPATSQKESEGENGRVKVPRGGPVSPLRPRQRRPYRHPEASPEGSRRRRGTRPEPSPGLGPAQPSAMRVRPVGETGRCETGWCETGGARSAVSKFFFRRTAPSTVAEARGSRVGDRGACAAGGLRGPRSVLYLPARCCQARWGPARWAPGEVGARRGGRPGARWGQGPGGPGPVGARPGGARGPVVAGPCFPGQVLPPPRTAPGRGFPTAAPFFLRHVGACPGPGDALNAARLPTRRVAAASGGAQNW